MNADRVEAAARALVADEGFGMHLRTWEELTEHDRAWYRTHAAIALAAADACEAEREAFDLDAIRARPVVSVVVTEDGDSPGYPSGYEQAVCLTPQERDALVALAACEAERNPNTDDEYEQVGWTKGWRGIWRGAVEGDDTWEPVFRRRAVISEDVHR